MSRHNLASQLTGVLRKRSGLSVCLCGEAGIGKSFTAQELLRATPSRSLTVRATVPVPELIRLFPKPEALPDWAERIREQLLTGPASTDSGVPHQTAPLLVAALIARQTPFVLLVEDLHEAGPETLEFWQDLAGAVARTKGAGLIGTSRGTAPDGFEPVALSAQTPEETAALAQAELGGPLPEPALAWIHGRAAGNPFYTLEHARYLARLGFLWSDGRRWRWRPPPGELVPRTLEAMIEHELCTVMPLPGVRAVLEAFSVLEAQGLVEPDLLLNIVQADHPGLSDDLVAQALALLEGAQVIRGASFRHPIYQEVVAQALHGSSFTGPAPAPPARQRLGRRAFEALEARDPVAAVRFLDQARVPDEQALEVLHRAERAARDRHDRVLTARLQAISTRFTTGRRCGEQALAAAQVLRGVSLREAVPLAERAIHECPGWPEAIYLLAELLATQGRMQDAESVLGQLPPEARGGPVWPERLLRLRAAARDFSGVQAVWEAHPALWETPSPEVVCHVGWALLHASDTRRARELVTRVQPEGLGPEEQADVQLIRAALDHYDGNVGAAAAGYLEASETFRRVGATEKLMHALRNLANALMVLGRYREARTHLLAALDTANGRGDTGDVCQTQVSLGALLTDMGEYEQAEDLLTEAQETLERMDPGLILSQCHESLFWLYRAWNPPLGPVLALKSAKSALDLAFRLGHRRLITQGQAISGAAQASSGESAQGLALLGEALGGARSLGEPERICLILYLYGSALTLAGRTPEAVAAYREAQALALSNGLSVEAHRTALELARLQALGAAVAEHLDWFRHAGLAMPGDVQLLDPEAGEPGGGPDGLRLEVLGPMRVVSGTQVLPVRGGRRQDLLAVLLEARLAGRGETSRLELFDALWPGEEEGRAAASLKSLVHSVRENFGQQIVATTTAGYTLGEITSDAEQFMQRSQETHWWRGPFLDGLEVRDELVREGVHSALLAAVRRLLDETKADEADRPARLAEAVRVSRLLIRADSYSRDALAVHLRALQASGNFRSLGRAYAEARDRMLEVGETLPEHWSAFLAAAAPDPGAAAGTVGAALR